MKLQAKNINLESIKKSNYWDLIAILVWNHYSEKSYQDDSMIEIEENYCGYSENTISYSSKWNNPNYTEPGLIRTLNNVLITFTRTDYITYIFIHSDGNISCFGKYTDGKRGEKSPNYLGSQRNLSITNWMIENNLIEYVNSNNTINIKPIKNSWSREEVIKLLNKFAYDVTGNGMLITSQLKANEYWIEENL